MARSLGTAVENNFTGGLVTEATSLNFPENAVTQTTNCVFDKTGSVYRRPGLDFETGRQITAVAKPNAAISLYLWRNTGGYGDLVISVVQIGPTLFFYKTVDGAVSGARYPFTINIPDFGTGGSFDPSQYECQYAVGNGYLIVTNPGAEPFFVTFNPVNGVFSTQLIGIGIRDFEGIDEPGLAVDGRPGDLSLSHYYNLYNQGWTRTQMDPFRTSVGGWPSNADVWWLLKDSNGNFKPGPIETQKAVNDKTITVYGDLRANSVYRGNTPAPRGHHTIGPFNLDRAGVSSIPNVPGGTFTLNRPSTVSFYSGRAFYAGVTGPSYTDKIYFTQIIQSSADFGKCYQVNDPTSENLFNLLATDGGVISIPEAGQIIRMFPVATSLLVFASNGIWAISGSTGIGFSATDYSVSKLSSITTLSATSFVDIEGFPAFWNDEGIYMVNAGQAGTLQVQSMTEKKIKAFYNAIPQDAKRYARGYYNPTEKTIQWLYRSSVSANVSDHYTYDRALIYSVLIEAFYPWSFNTPTGLSIAGLFTTFGTETRQSLVSVTDNALVTTTTTGGQPVTVLQDVTSPVTFSYKYLVFNQLGFTFAELKPNDHRDFQAITYESNFTTGYKLRGEAVKKSQTNYLIVFFQKEYGATFAVQSLWDYSNSGNSNKWSVNQIVEAGRGYQDYDFRRLKVRGQGRAVQYRFKSIGDNPFNLSGWATVDSVNGNI